VTEVVTGNVHDKYGTANPMTRRLMRGFLSALDDLLPREAPTRVLEIGTGEGVIAGRVRGRYPTASVVGLDLDDPRLADEWRAAGLPCVVGDATRLPLRHDSIDLVLAIEVLEHVEHAEAALAEIARVATGDVVLSVPREPLWRALNMARGAYLRDRGNTPGHVRHWSSARFVDLVSRHLDVRRVVRPVPWTVVAARARAPQ
jgi:ubiquinone/menaquinone biosynthesis C-methylase UbiE